MFKCPAALKKGGSALSCVCFCGEPASAMLRGLCAMRAEAGGCGVDAQAAGAQTPGAQTASARAHPPVHCSHRRCFGVKPISGRSMC